MPERTDSADHWRSLAREVRSVAESMTDAAAKLIMLKIAQGYERLAANSEARDKEPK
jgi:hypothetical protein